MPPIIPGTSGYLLPECACQFGYQCPLHASAKKLYEALEQVTGEFMFLAKPGPQIGAINRANQALYEASRPPVQPAPVEHQPNLADRTDPVLPNSPHHLFQAVTGNRFCGWCGGGRLHAIHTELFGGATRPVPPEEEETKK
jgi:hypothetical protein